MALPSRNKVFALENCRDLLDKLQWEIDQFDSDADIEVRAYHAFNAAVTAWQLADWIFEDMTEAQRIATGLHSLGDLQDHARTERALYLCQQIATSSKHAIMRNHSDDLVDVAVSAVGETEAEITWLFRITDANTKREAVEVFELAHAFWTTFIYGNRIAD